MTVLFQIFIGMFTLMTALWCYQVKTKNATMVDVGWSWGMGASALYLATQATGDMGVRILTATLLGLWSLRLGWHLFRARILGSQQEDSRYQTIRERLGQQANRGFFFIFQAQSLFVILFMAPLFIVMNRSEPLWAWHDMLALELWIIAMLGETVADKQLQSFKENPDNKGKTCQIGLWRYSRHPNYFFEWLQWFTYPLIAWGTSYGWVTWLLPFIMLVFLWKITGIPYSESQALKHRKDYAAYQQSTSMFVPWFKR